MVERRVGHWRRHGGGEASCKLVTGSLALELQQAAGERRRVERRDGGGDDRRAAGWGGGFTPLEAPGRSGSNSNSEQEDEMKKRLLLLHNLAHYSVSDEGSTTVCQETTKQ